MNVATNLLVTNIQLHKVAPEMNGLNSTNKLNHELNFTLLNSLYIISFHII